MNVKKNISLDSLLVQLPITFHDALEAINANALGIIFFLGQDSKLAGVFTDGDLRRTLEKEIDFKNTTIQSVMTPKGITVQPDMMATEALYLMEKHKIIPLLVVNDDNILVGAFNIHDLFRAGIV